MDIQEYQKNCFDKYKDSISYPNNLTYLYGNPLKVLVPIETALGKIMIIGAYPSAKFFTINGIRDVPLYDNDSPFSNESYFDGSRVRTIPSGEELNRILHSIGVLRQDCWITDLVKVFLFKEGHVEKYRELKKANKEIKNHVEIENRSNFVEFARQSIFWIEQEIILAKPKIAILLGTEVTSILFNISAEVAKSYLNGEKRTLKIMNITIDTLCFPHPGILMREFKGNPWPKKFENIIAPKAKIVLQEMNLSSK